MDQLPSPQTQQKETIFNAIGKKCSDAWNTIESTKDEDSIKTLRGRVSSVFAAPVSIFVVNPAVIFAGAAKQCLALQDLPLACLALR